MPHVSLIVEALRARPVAVFWVAALAQALIWAVVPALLYASPPGELPELLGVGREWQPGSWRGPPLASWLADLAFRATGGRLLGVYVLSQVCVVVAYWAIFTLGRAIVGVHHAAMAVLLMGGIVVLSLPTPEFGPAVLALPLSALSLLHLWRALGEGRRNAWIALAFDLGLLLLATYWGFLLIALMALFLPLTREGRAALATVDPWATVVLALVIPFPHAVWLWRSGLVSAGGTLAFPALDIVGRLAFWPLALAAILAAHLGLIVLVALASGWRADRQILVPEIDGLERSPLARSFAWFFALAPMLVGALALALLDADDSPNWAGPLVLMSGLAVIVAAGPRIAVHHQRLVGVAWPAVLLLAPSGLILAAAIGPWTSFVDLSSGRPAAAMGRFFTDTFQRRVGRPLAIVAGDTGIAYLTAVSSADYPRVYSPGNPERTPWLTDRDVREHGAIVLWPLQDPTGEPPPAIRARFPEIVAEVPQSFERPIQGMLPTLRVGWALIRPKPQALSAPSAAGRR